MLGGISNQRWRMRASAWVAGIVLSATVAVVGLHVMLKPPSLLEQMDVKSAIFDMKKVMVTPLIARGNGESFYKLTERSKPAAAITGTYYGPDGKPLGDILVNGKLINKGYQRQGIGFTRSGEIRFLEREGRNRIDWRNCNSGIACGPRLVRAGKIDINVRRDGFTDSAAMVSARRCAIGATADGKLVLCVVRKPVTLSVLADIMLKLGAKDAINMDGGSMCAFYESGKYHAEAMGSMNNVVVVSTRK